MGGSLRPEPGFHDRKDGLFRIEEYRTSQRARTVPGVKKRGVHTPPVYRSSSTYPSAHAVCGGDHALNNKSHAETQRRGENCKRENGRRWFSPRFSLFCVSAFLGVRPAFHESSGGTRIERIGDSHELTFRLPYLSPRLPDSSECLPDAECWSITNRSSRASRRSISLISTLCACSPGCRNHVAR